MGEFEKVMICNEQSASECSGEVAVKEGREEDQAADGSRGEGGGDPATGFGDALGVVAGSSDRDGDFGRRQHEHRVVEIEFALDHLAGLARLVGVVAGWKRVRLRVGPEREKREGERRRVGRRGWEPGVRRWRWVGHCEGVTQVSTIFASGS